jgi:hypothetical protein
LAVGAILINERRAWCFRASSSFGDGLANSSENTADLSVLDKWLPQGAPALAYKIVRFCLVPLSNAGGLGILGATGFSPDQMREQIAAIRGVTTKPFGVNFLLFMTQEASFAAALEARPPVISLAWARSDQDLSPYVKHVHEAGLVVMYMPGEVSEAVRH